MEKADAKVTKEKESKSKADVKGSTDGNKFDKKDSSISRTPR